MFFDHRCFLPWEDSARIAARGEVLAIASIRRNYTQHDIVLSMTSMIALLRSWEDSNLRPLDPETITPRQAAGHQERSFRASQEVGDKCQLMSYIDIYCWDDLGGALSLLVRNDEAIKNWK
ncbi:MAG: hypothetical protein E4H23_11175 [Chrysiogenales bacterium]|nr:MAG: hypothetical protein E4H23_11175 [Chrysiogenales bacterium]